MRAASSITNSLVHASPQTASQPCSWCSWHSLDHQEPQPNATRPRLGIFDPGSRPNALCLSWFLTLPSVFMKNKNLFSLELGKLQKINVVKPLYVHLRIEASPHLFSSWLFRSCFYSSNVSILLKQWYSSFFSAAGMLELPHCGTIEHVLFYSIHKMINTVMRMEMTGKVLKLSGCLEEKQ